MLRKRIDLSKILFISNIIVIFIVIIIIEKILK